MVQSVWRVLLRCVSLYVIILLFFVTFHWIIVVIYVIPLAMAIHSNLPVFCFCFFVGVLFFFN